MNCGRKKIINSKVLSLENSLSNIWALGSSASLGNNTESCENTLNSHKAKLCNSLENNFSGFNKAERQYIPNTTKSIKDYLPSLGRFIWKKKLNKAIAINFLREFLV